MGSRADGTKVVAVTVEVKAEKNIQARVKLTERRPTS